ncbi:MAG: nuclear transport factor 2 family protein [Rhodospirillaceae bacterium]|nr:nuclear transport factor 2 family protein [Rhodospirillaceae bacterium]
MKKICGNGLLTAALAVILVLVGIAYLQHHPLERSAEGGKLEILSLLEAYAGAYGRGETDTIIAQLPDDNEVIFLGSTADGISKGKDAIRDQINHDLEQTEKVAMTITGREIDINGNIAWIAADSVVHATIKGQSLVFPGRLTGVFEHTDKGWVWRQANFSLPLGAMSQGQSFPRKN